MRSRARTNSKHRGAKMSREFCPARILHLIVVALIILGIAEARAQSPESSSRPPKQAERMQSKQNVPAPNTPSDAANAKSTYVIGPGDLLAINVLHGQEVSEILPESPKSTYSGGLPRGPP